MKYRFTGLSDPPQYERGLISQYGGTVLDEIVGVTTLRVDGRGKHDRQFEIISSMDSETDTLVSSKYQPIALTVLYQLEAENELAVPTLLRSMLGVFKNHPGRLQFSDDEYYYNCSLGSVSLAGVGPIKLVTCNFKSYTPYAHKDVEIHGPVFDVHTDYPVVPDKIELIARSQSKFLEVSNPRTGSKLRIHTTVEAGDTITIEPNANFGIRKGAQNLMPYLEPSSEFENFEMAFLDALTVIPNSEVRMWAKLKKLG